MRLRLKVLRSNEAKLGVALGVVLYEAVEWVESLATDIGACLSIFSTVIIVDNGDDGAGQRLLSLVPSVILIENDTNLGHSHGVNQILSHAQQDAVLLADHDVHWTPDVVLSLLAALSTSSDRQWAFTPVVRGKHGVDSRAASWSVGPFGTVCEYPNRFRDDAIGGPPTYCAPKHTSWFCPTTFVLLDRTKHHPQMIEQYFVYWNDVDMFLSAARLGYEVCTIEADVWHGNGSPGVAYRQGSKAPDLHEFYQTRNRWLFALTNYRMTHLLALLPVFIVLEVGNMANLLKTGQSRVAIRAYGAVLRLLGPVLSIRRSKRWGLVSELNLISPSCVGIAPARAVHLTRLQRLVLDGSRKIFRSAFTLLKASRARADSTCRTINVRCRGSSSDSLGA